MDVPSPTAGTGSTLVAQFGASAVQVVIVVVLMYVAYRYSLGRVSNRTKRRLARKGADANTDAAAAAPAAGKNATATAAQPADAATDPDEDDVAPGTAEGSRLSLRILYGTQTFKAKGTAQAALVCWRERRPQRCVCVPLAFCWSNAAYAEDLARQAFAMNINGVHFDVSAVDMKDYDQVLPG